ncbi:MAG: tetratricopeptide repeat protein [Hyphomicrobiaceae bacterium]
MTATQYKRTPSIAIAARITAVASLAVLLGACAQGGAPDLGLGLGMSNDDVVSSADAGSNDMSKALNYWGRKYVKTPSDKTAALNYAKNLKASGQSKQAFLVLQQASVLHGNDREIASEYGRLALEAGQVQLASKLLTLADDRTKPDWRVVSGRGAALARQGKYKAAVPMFERAHQLAPSNSTVLNNLAMAHAGSGNLGRAESLLRQAAQNPMAKEKVAKNLALVLKLQGRKAEAAAVSAGASLAMRKSVSPERTASGSAKVAQAAHR